MTQIGDAAICCGGSGRERRIVIGVKDFEDSQEHMLDKNQIAAASRTLQRPLARRHQARGARSRAAAARPRRGLRDPGRDRTHSSAKLFGWKIAATSEAGQKHINVAGPMAGRILAETVIADGGTASMAGNEMRVAEPEFAFRMARDLPPRSPPYTRAEVLDAVDTLHPAIEIPDSRFADFVSAGEAQLIADNACAHLFVLGAPTTPNWRALDLVEEKPVITLRGQRYRRSRQERARRSPRRAGLARQRIARARHHAAGRRGGHDRHLPSAAADPVGRSSVARRRFRCRLGKGVGRRLRDVDVPSSLPRSTRSSPRCPKIAEPTRTWVAPNWIAIAKSALMPIDRFFRPLRAAIFAVSAKCGAGASSTGGMHIRPEIARPYFSRQARDEGVGLAGRDAGLLRLLAGIDLDEQFAAAVSGIRFPWLTLGKCSDGRPNGWRRTAPRPPSPCWIAAARSDAARGRGKPTLTPGHFALASCTRFSPKTRCPAFDHRRNRVGIESFGHRDQRHRRAIAARLACRRARSPAPPRRARLVNARLSAR